MVSQTQPNDLHRHSVNRVGYFLYVILFFLVCSLPLVGMAMGHESPNLEKRTLAQAPSLIVEGQVNLEATSQFDDYYADQFAFRSYLVSAYHQLNQRVLGQSGSSKVISGRSGWLFFQETLADFLASPLLSDTEMRRLAVTLSLQKEYLRNKGIDFYFMVAPNKNSVYGEFMPKRLSPVHPDNNLNRWLASPHAQAVSTIDLLTPLKSAARTAQTPLYHQTDTHWNNLGARIGFQNMMRVLSNHQTAFTFDDLESKEAVIRKDWPGDLAIMLYPSGVDPENQYYFDLPQNYRTKRPMRSLEDLMIQTNLFSSGVTSYSAAQKKVWMFRDSFANALIPFMANTFGEVTFSREIPYNYSSIDKTTADIVVLQIVERNLPQLLLRAPIVPAPERDRPQLDGIIADDAQPELTRASLQDLRVVPHGKWLGLTGFFKGPANSLDTIKTILIGINDRQGQRRYVEATPISELGQTGDLGLTAYFTENSWHSGIQQVDILYLASENWHHQKAEVNLP